MKIQNNLQAKGIIHYDENYGWRIVLGKGNANKIGLKLLCWILN